MTQIDALHQYFTTGEIPHFPVVVILNNDGKIRIDSIEENKFFDQIQYGAYAGIEWLNHIPKQDANGRWVGVKKKAAVFVKGGLLQITPSGLN